MGRREDGGSREDGEDGTRRGRRDKTGQDGTRRDKTGRREDGKTGRREDEKTGRREDGKTGRRKTGKCFKTYIFAYLDLLGGVICSVLHKVPYKCSRVL